MPETLLTPSGIKIYGRVMQSLTLAPPALRGVGQNEFLARQLNAANPQLARIYGFSFEGHYYDLAKPAIFLVHGTGTAVRLQNPDRTDMDTSGVVAREWEFASNAPGPAADLMYWEYDKGDFSLRLDIETGPFEQILLAAALRGGPSFSSGAQVVSGAQVARRGPSG